MTLLWILGAVGVVSIISLVGILALMIQPKLRSKLVFYLVAFSAGVLMGDAFLHLIPEAIETSTPETISLWTIGGFLIFLLIERFLHWRHCHDDSCQAHAHSFTKMILIGDGVHNIIDGIIIAVSFMVSIPLGVATTIAVIAHEIPQEIGDFNVLVYGGYSPKRALRWNFISALTAFVGAFVGWNVGASEEMFSILLPLTAGGFIYISTVDLLPEIHREKSLKKSILALLFFLLGLGAMWLLKVVFE